jgi:hypothetical protein
VHLGQLLVQGLIARIDPGGALERGRGTRLIAEKRKSLVGAK